MRRPLARVVPRRLVPPLLWVIALTALGGLGFRWSLPPPPPPPSALGNVAASAAPAPRHITRSLSELGLSGPLAPRGLSDYALLFSRVPKAGSELLALLLQRLQAANGFRLLQLPRTAAARRLSAPEQEELVAGVTDALRREAVPVVFHGAVYFTNFSTFDRQSPTYVSLLRDPVERAMAGLYLAARASATTTPPPHSANASRRKRRRTGGAAGADGGNHLHRPGPDATADGDLVDILERCLTSAKTTTATAATPRLAECAWAEPQSPYFCGHDSRCRSENGDWALKRAMATIDQHYPVVGVLEELNATLAVLEARLPLFFAGVRDVYRHQLREPHINWDRKKLLNFRPEIRERIQKRLALEYELYIWAKQRLMLQHFEDSQKEPLPGEAGQDRLVLSIDKKSSSVQVAGKY